MSKKGKIIAIVSVITVVLIIAITLIVLFVFPGVLKKSNKKSEDKKVEEETSKKKLKEDDDEDEEKEEERTSKKRKRRNKEETTEEETTEEETTEEETTEEETTEEKTTEQETTKAQLDVNNVELLAMKNVIVQMKKRLDALRTQIRKLSDTLLTLGTKKKKNETAACLLASSPHLSRIRSSSICSLTKAPWRLLPVRLPPPASSPFPARP